MIIVLGLAELHDPPPPVHCAAVMETTVCAVVVLAVTVLAQGVPRPAAPQVYVKSPAATEGFVAVKSDVAFMVMVELPAADVRA